MWGMGIGHLLGIALVLFALGAVIKYLFFR
jgi:hypothetical protein